jgi:mRNA-degrading endonuclease RelE of RelBE toxin-antitoxin system
MHRRLRLVNAAMRQCLLENFHTFKAKANGRRLQQLLRLHSNDYRLMTETGTGSPQRGSEAVNQVV